MYAAYRQQEHVQEYVVGAYQEHIGSRDTAGKEEHRSMRRTVKKSLWMSKEEEWDLKQKAQAACLTESEFIRQRIAGYTPPHQIDDRFWRAMDLIREFADRIDAIAMNADKTTQAIAVMAEAKKWRMFQNAIEMEFLRPKRGDG